MLNFVPNFLASVEKSPIGFSKYIKSSGSMLKCLRTYPTSPFAIKTSLLMHITCMSESWNAVTKELIKESTSHASLPMQMDISFSLILFLFSSKNSFMRFKKFILFT
ncbi:hypothetical protein EHP00_1533 [Ecytonucleospora hepatopenaei]|uniref:Uncharacterized protein n=1 Tax=Ecytonucleospora hepatopenaei TaxID=646526 RepID=A0A1W0E3B5_9MICR|nr:hypothetical protein EHP00_1533 [Ecytonucleospora hepatopenaei]